MAAAAAEGCLLNMPRKIGFEILIFPRRVSTIPAPPLPLPLPLPAHPLAFFSLSTVLRLARWAAPTIVFPE